MYLIFCTIKDGIVSGILLGGNLLSTNSLIGTPYSPDYTNSIWFWEEVNECPAKVDFYLSKFKLSGNLNKIKAMIIGHLSGYGDKKYPQDNRDITDIILELTKGYNFPIIKTQTFGHEIAKFYTYPIGIVANLDTGYQTLTFDESSVK